MPDALAIFTSSLRDATGQPNLVIDSPECQQLIWNLVNNMTEPIEVTPFDPRGVSPEQYHFVFLFKPGVLTSVPSLQGWDVDVGRDESNAIKSLYVAWSGNTPLSIAPGGHQTTPLTYAEAVQEDANSSTIGVTLKTGKNVKLGSRSIPDQGYGPFHLTLVHANTPALSAPPLAVDFVGRRTVLNDHKTANSFTFALTNMTQANFSLTPNPGAGDTSYSKFTVWFDVAPNQSNGSYPWALARVQDLASQDVALVPTPPSQDWKINPLTPTALSNTAVSPEWEITVTRTIDLKPQEPVLFTFSRIKTDLDPGICRMYLRFENVSVFRPGVLIAELEKTPLSYGATRGQGLYLTAGTPGGDTPPVVDYDSGFSVQQFGNAPAAKFQGGDGLSILSAGGKAWNISSDGATPSGAGKLLIQESSTKEHPVTFHSGGVDVGDFNTKTDQHIALKVAADSTYTAGIELRAGSGNVGFTIDYNNKKPALQISRHWNSEPIVALEVEPQTGKLTVYDDLAVTGDINGKTLTVGGDALVVSKDTIKMSKPLTAPSLQLSGGLKMDQANAVIQRGDGKITNGDLGLYSTGNGNWLRFVTNQGFIKFFTDGGDGTNPVLTINTDGTLESHGQYGINVNATSAPSAMLRLSTHNYTGVSNFDNNAEISNDVVTGYGKALMLVGNSSRQATATRWVQVWDNLEVKGNLYVSGKAAVYFSAYSAWYSLGYRGGNYGAWYDDIAPPATSDLRLKSELQSISSAMDKVRQLRGVTFRWNERALQHFTRDVETSMSAGPNATERENHEVWQAERERRRRQLEAATYIGVVAQDVEAVLPEAVITGADGYKSVRYDDLIPLLIEAIKEQNLEIERLKEALPKRGETRPEGTLNARSNSKQD